MPELPEVETLCRQLRPAIVGAEIVSTRVFDSKLGGIKGLQGRKVRSVTRHGKALEVELEGGRKLVLHFRMTGRLLWQNGNHMPSQNTRNGMPPHTRLVISFPHGTISLIDPRRFATVAVRHREDPLPLGRDPLDGFDSSPLLHIAQQCALPVKAFLMDQRRISGIGNIYACEILHEARMDPWRRANGLSHDDWSAVEIAAEKILRKAIDCRGTSVSDWRDLFGREGEHQNFLSVYGRAGTGCPRCGGIIERRKLSGRGTYYCPNCQSRTGG